MPRQRGITWAAAPGPRRTPTSDEYSLDPRELAQRVGTPATIAGWRALADTFLSDPCCAFHRNVEISSRYASLHQQLPTCFKWSGMAAIASHHVRHALFPLRLDSDRTGYVDIPRSLGRSRLLLLEDVNTIRATNNAIFDDIFWVHLAYLAADDGIEHLRDLLSAEPAYAAVLSGFEAIDRGRRVLEDSTASAQARREAENLVWSGNTQLLEHEQRALVQPNFDRLTVASARIASMGAATSFDSRDVRQALGYFTSFYPYSLGRMTPRRLTADGWPRITRFEDRWGWLEGSVVPRFRRFTSDTRLVDAGLQRILEEAREYASSPCVIPVPS